ncbi:hypothetical protein LUZ63_014270 [Rhynchospora breviuscula]|uniref:Uncharacterized protein n=1 Tax=Rhynchospora breviuscula TaxID=2022672 RepID=A0A9Q0CA47_9POAL|nr:hypothetical protein LUZ63_014270 [Rhynchospora breviuscula]
MAPERISSPPKLPPKTRSSDKNRNKKQLPSPEEILSHYESQGLDTRAASLEAISHLQALLFKTVASNSASSVRKVDTINTRLAIIEAKLDSKPGFVQSMAIGVVSVITDTDAVHYLSNQDPVARDACSAAHEPFDLDLTAREPRYTRTLRLSQALPLDATLGRGTHLFLLDSATSATDLLLPLSHSFSPIYICLDVRRRWVKWQYL